MADENKIDVGKMYTPAQHWIHVVIISGMCTVFGTSRGTDYAMKEREAMLVYIGTLQAEMDKHGLLKPKQTKYDWEK